jgi:hypothetical protein
MGVDLRMENGRGTEVAAVPDVHAFMPIIVEIAGPDATTCLPFIDAYGNTVFNQLQIPVLIRELERARDNITPAAIAEIHQGFVEGMRRAKMDPRIIESYEFVRGSRSASDVRAHLELVLELARRAVGQVHTYLKFYGD